VQNAGMIFLFGLIAVYALASKRLSTTALTGPMLFMLGGLAVGPTGLAMLDEGTNVRLVSLLLEVTLVVVLFTDAFNIDFDGFRDVVQLPGRLLGIGFPLMVGIGWLVAYVMFPDLGVAGAGLVAVLLAPTDAALGQAVISNPGVPPRIRNALNIESGLNDGLALPLFFVLLDAAEAMEGIGGGGQVLWAVLWQVTVAILVGIALGVGGTRIATLARRRRWTDSERAQIALTAIALLSWAAADALGASGFIAAWVAGFSGGIVGRRELDRPVEFSEDLGSVLTLISFALFGALGLGENLADMDVRVVGYALLSLLVFRLVAVLAATVRARLGAATVLYLGWFGPRGLASIILVLIVVEESDLAEAPLISRLMIATVSLSVLLHGASSWWGSNRYAKWFERNRGDVGWDHDVTAVEPPS
jgi:NhaP-type Na+/H+ or K+/H+ antiporter